MNLFYFKIPAGYKNKTICLNKNYFLRGPLFAAYLKGELPGSSRSAGSLLDPSLLSSL